MHKLPKRSVSPTWKNVWRNVSNCEHFLITLAFLTRYIQYLQNFHNLDPLGAQSWNFTYWFPQKFAPSQKQILQHLGSLYVIFAVFAPGPHWKIPVPWFPSLAFYSIHKTDIYLYVADQQTAKQGKSWIFLVIYHALCLMCSLSMSRQWKWE